MPAVVYVVEGHDDDITRRTLRFKASQNDSRNVETKGFGTMPVSSSSIVGATVLQGEPINITDLYNSRRAGHRQ